MKRCMRYVAWLMLSAVSVLADVEVDPQAAALKASRSLDETQASIRATLAALAARPEAQRGSWEELEPLMVEATAPLTITGTWFYVRPDGSYFRMGHGLTGLNLRDRPYFDPLFRGEEITGFPLYSRSTGKKSAFFALPVRDENGCSGAIAVSLFLDEWHKKISGQLNLPPHYTWFVVNREGVTLLDRDPEFIMMNALTQGGPTLRKAMEIALAGESGRVAYELAGTPRDAVYQRVPGVDWRVVVARMEPEQFTALQAEVQIRLQRVVRRMQALLNNLDADIAAALAPWQGRLGNEEELRPVMKKLVADNSIVAEVGFVTDEDILVMIEPPDYAPFEGSDISDYRRTETVRQKGGPFLTDMLVSVEGIPCVLIVHPVHDADGDLAGSVSVLINPAVLLAKAVGSGLPADQEIWAMQLDGKIIYDVNEEEVGRMLLSDPLYAEHNSLLALGRRMLALPEGQGTYVFASATKGENAIKAAEWLTHLPQLDD